MVAYYRTRERDAFGHAQLGGLAPMLADLIKDRLGLKYHWAVADYLQRAARHIASQTDLDQAYALGAAAVELAINGSNAIMPTIVREQDSPYRWSIGSVALSEVANVEKMMPRSFITDDGFNITSEARQYFRPLIMGEAYPPYGGLPNYVRLANIRSIKAFPEPALVMTAQRIKRSNSCSSLHRSGSVHRVLTQDAPTKVGAKHRH